MTQQLVNSDPKATAADSVESNETSWSKFTSCRWTLAFILLLLRMCQTALRQSIGMALVCMAERPGPSPYVAESSGVPGRNYSGVAVHYNNSDAYSSSSGVNVSKVATATLPPPGDGHGTCREFTWDPTFEGIVLSSYYYGYLLTPLLSGYAVRWVGAKRLVACCVGMGAIINLLTPGLTRTHSYLLVVLRVLAGTTNGMIDPAVQSLWAVWAPRSEIAYLTAVEYAGVSMGGIFTFLISGLLCQIPVDNGWPLIFYFYGTTSIIWVTVWMTLISNSPNKHPRISPAELKYILSETHSVKEGKVTKIHPPWGRILCSGPVWAIIVATATFMWVYSWILSYLPTYMEDVLKFNISENAVYSSLPFVGKFVSGLLCGYLADRLLRTRMSVACNRKMFQMIGCIGCAACMLAVGFLDVAGRTSAVVLLVLAVSLQNVTTVAYRINVLDIAPRYSSFILGVSSTAAVAFSLTAPLVTSAVVVDKSLWQWRIMFCIIAALCVAGGVTFLLLGSADIQPWAKWDESSDYDTYANGHIENGHVKSKDQADNDLYNQGSELTPCITTTESNGNENTQLSMSAADNLLSPSALQHDHTHDKENKSTSQVDIPQHIILNGAGSTPSVHRLGSPYLRPKLSPNMHRLAMEKVFDLEAASQWSSSLSLSG